MVMRFLKLSLVAFLLFPACARSGRCYFSATKRTRTSTRCGLWNRCTRYSTKRYTASKCCEGWTGSDCNTRIPKGPYSARLTPTTATESVTEGFNMRTITCYCDTCIPSCTIRWSRNGNTISTSGRLQMNNVSRKSAGTYTCTCKNTKTSASKSIRFSLNVRYGPDDIVVSPGNTSFTIEEGDSLEPVTCGCLKCHPSCLAKWTFQDTVISNSSILKLSNISRNATGPYDCVCTHPLTSEEEHKQIYVRIQYGPDLVFVVPHITSYNKTIGSHLQNVTCTCGDCYPKCTAAWTFNGTERSRNDVIYINWLSKSDAGRYTCICSNPSTLQTMEAKHFDLIVNEIANAPSCPQHKDEWDTTWEKAYAGEMVSTDCKEEDYKGRILRLCSKTGKWLIPQYDCISEAFAEVEEKLEELKRNSSNKELSNVLDTLVNLTDSNGDGDGLYAGELKSITRALGIIAKLAAGGIPTTEQQSKLFMTVVDNVLNKDKRRSWKSLSQTEESDGGSKLLQAVDVLSELLGNGLEDTNRSFITFLLPNIVLAAEKIDSSQSEINFPIPFMTTNLDTSMGTKLTLPLQNNSASGIRCYTVAVYNSLAGVLPITLATRNNTENDRSQSLNTPVVSLQVFPYQPKLEKPLRLVLKHKQTHFRSPKCAYWTFKRNQWETDGCRIVASTRWKTTCECYHLSSFAVLVSPWNEPTVDSMAVETIPIIGCSISIICLISTVAVHLLSWRNLKNERAVSLINICVALTVTYILFLSGIHQTSDKDGCTAVAVLLHYMTLVVFCLMLVESIEISITVKFVFDTKSRIKWMIPIAWGVPATIVGLSMAVTQLKGYGTQNCCWLTRKNGVIWAFVGPALLIIVANVLFLAALLRAVLKTKTDKDMSEDDRIRRSVRFLCVLVPLMGCTWILGIFYVNERSAWMQYVFALCSSMLGLSIFFFHGLPNKQLHNAISRLKKYTDSLSLTTLTKKQSTRRTEDQCAMNPVYSSDVPFQSPSKPNPVLKYGRKLSVQLTQSRSYSPMQESLYENMSLK